jgi:ABC-type multidrug transport system ATPase subunit
MISIANLSKRYGTGSAVQGVTFSCTPGTITGFLGANGAGKSTTLRMLTGLTRPDTGSATIDGKAFTSLSNPARTVGVMLDSSALHVGRTGRETLRVAAMIAGVPAGRADELLSATGLAGAARRRVGTYSLGMRQRLGLAAALLRAPRLLILDEPANGLDPRGIRELRDLLAGLSAAGTTIFLSSHQLSEVEQLCSRVGVVDRGRLVLQDDLAALRAPTGRVLIRSPEPDRVAAALDGQVARRDGDTLVVTAPDTAALNARLVGAGIPVSEIRPERRSLEDLVLALTTASADRVDRVPRAAAAPAAGPAEEGAAHDQG